MLIYLSLLYSFLTTSSKIKVVFRLLLIIQFWCIISLMSIIFFNNTSSIFFMDIDIKTFLGVFLFHYMISDSFDFYSNLDPSNSKHILDSLHELLKNLDIKKYCNWPNGGGDHEPDITPYLYHIVDQLKWPNRGGDPEPEFIPYMDHILDTKTGIKSKFMQEGTSIPFDKVWLEEKCILIDQHNEKLVRPIGKELIVEKNKIISYNSFIDYNHHDAYGLAMASLCLDDFFLLQQWYF
jgi:hypothetical protein